MAEQLFCKQLAVSSNLTVGSMGRCRSGQSELAVNQSGFALRRFESFSAHPAHVAQSVEHILGKNEVPGSSPGVGSNSVKDLRGARRALSWSFPNRLTQSDEGVSAGDSL